MKFKPRHIFFGLIITTVTILLFINHERIKIDGISGELLSLHLRPDTKYSAGYSHEGFNMVTVGMSEKEVLEILGEPLVRWLPYDHSDDEEKENWVSFQYSESPSSSHYRLRQVLFNEKGTVEKKTGYYWVD